MVYHRDRYLKNEAALQAQEPSAETTSGLTQQSAFDFIQPLINM